MQRHAYHRDRDYIVVDGSVVIVDEFTGRPVPGKRWPDGLHQAVEVKERVEIQPDIQTAASTTYQGLICLYKRFAGMSATVSAANSEFREIYQKTVVNVPPHTPLQRVQYPDQLLQNRGQKLNTIVDRAQRAHIKGQPVLLGTHTIEHSHEISKELHARGIEHEVLNALNPEREAAVVSSAGRKGAVTVAANMAGRGTDIRLEHGVVDLGGLLVIGAERHDSKRLDDQLVGRCARQGDPGEAIFYICPVDDAVRVFGGDRLAAQMYQDCQRSRAGAAARNFTRA